MTVSARKYYGVAAAVVISVIVFTSIFFSAATSGFCSGNSLAFRPVLAKDDLNGKKFDLIKDERGDIYIWRLRYLADRDIKKIDTFRSAAAVGRLLVGFTLSDDGAKRLRYFTKKFGLRRLVIFADGRLIGMIPAVPPTFLGDKIVVRWPGTEMELRAFAVKMNSPPPSMLALYVEEIGRYNDVAADAWASAYEDVNRYIEDKREESKAGKMLVEELQQQGDGG